MTVGGALLAALILGVFAYLIADGQSEDKEDVEERFQDVAAGFRRRHGRDLPVGFPVDADAGRRGLLRPDRAERARGVRTAGPVAVRGGLRRPKGRRLGATPGTPHPGPAVDTARETGQPRLSDVMGTGKEATIEFAIPYETPSGRRIFVTGSPTQPFADFLAASLGQLPTFADAETAMVDSNGIVLGGDNLSSPVGAEARRPRLARGAPDRGVTATMATTATSRPARSPTRRSRSSSTRPKSDLYESISGRTVTWIIFAAFALASVRRALLPPACARSATLSSSGAS